MTGQTFTCQQLIELVTDYFEMKLSDADTQRFEEHLAMCKGCTRYVAQMRQTIRALGKLSTTDLSPQIQQELLEAFRTWHSD